jgi:hypothetical protein
MVVEASLGVLQEDMRKRRSGEMRLHIVLNASSIRFTYLDFSMADVGSVSVFMVNLYNPLLRRGMTKQRHQEKTKAQQGKERLTS